MAIAPLRGTIVSQISSLKSAQPKVFSVQNVRFFKTNTILQNEKPHFVRRARDRIGLKDRAMGPTTGLPFSVGRLKNENFLLIDAL